MNRSAGILLPLSSLPSRYGIGCFSKSAYEFVDWLKGGRTELLADPSAGTDQLRGFPVSVIFHVCGKSLLYQPGSAD